MSAVDDAAGSANKEEIISVNEHTQEKDINSVKEITDDFSKAQLIGGGQDGGGTADVGGEAIVAEKEAVVDEAPILAKTQEIYLQKDKKEIDFNYVKKITDNFSKGRILGGGQVGGGTAYLGEEGIVVNKLQKKAPVPRDEKFKDKLEKIVALNHDNIVKFVGYCVEAPRRSTQHVETSSDQDAAENLLCYKYVSNGSLRENLFGITAWDKRLKIIDGICQGLLYLHTLEQPIIHMDLKPENILLDDNLLPKIADFGIAVEFDKEQDPMHTNDVVGTYGYMAPEYKHKGEMSLKTDIYSLGLVILQTTTKEMNPETQEQPCARKYIDQICEKWTEEYIASSYPALDSYCLQQVKACIKIGLECVEIDPANRPSIDKIVDELNESCAG